MDTYSLDEPLHGVDLIAPIKTAPLSLALEVRVEFLVVTRSPLSTIVLSGLAVLDLDHGKIIRSTVGQALHDSTLDNRLPGVGRLHDLDVLIDSVAEALLEVVGRTKATNQEHGTDRHVTRDDLLLDKCDDFQHNWLENTLQIRGLQGESATADAKSLVVGETTHRNSVGLIRSHVQCKLAFDLGSRLVSN